MNYDGTGVYERTVYAMLLTEKSFATTLTVREVLDLVLPGRAFLPRAKNDPIKKRMVEDLEPFHDVIQRSLTGRKLKNSKEGLKNYVLEQWVPKDGSGILPPLVIWFRKQIEVRWFDNSECRPLLQAVIPPGVMGLALDGESRIEAFLYAIEEASGDKIDELLTKRLSVTVLHDTPPEKASKWFADINGRGSGVNPNLLIARDYTDRWAQLAIDTFEELKIDLEKQKRQVSARSSAVISAMQARTMTAAIGLGLSAVTYGSKEIPTKNAKDEDIIDDWGRFENAVKVWLRDVFEKFPPEHFKDKEQVLRSVPVLVSIGAIGKGIYSQESKELEVAQRFLADESIVWQRGERWNGIAGKINAAGSFSVGSGKENAYATYRALTDETDPGYTQIRRGAPTGATGSEKEAEVPGSEQ
tara:strand:+ start:2265 stop:3506 length:1242 start_codon:yes stop_codon:yes gene_type:complete